MVAPGWDHHPTPEANDCARSFATRVDHPKGASQLALPTNKGMHRSASINILKAVIAPFDHMEQSARRAATRVILGRKQNPIAAHPQSKGIPKPFGDPADIPTRFGAVKHTPLAPTHKRLAIAATKRPVFAKVLAERENQPTIGMPSHPAQAVVRIVGQRIEPCDRFLGIPHPIVVGILHPQNPIALGDIKPTVGPPEQLHRRFGLVVKHPSVFSFGVKNQNLVKLRPLIARRSKMGMAGNHPNVPLRVQVDPGRSDQFRMLGQPFDSYPRYRCLYPRGSLVRRLLGRRCFQGQSQKQPRNPT